MYVSVGSYLLKNPCWDHYKFLIEWIRYLACKAKFHLIYFGLQHNLKSSLISILRLTSWRLVPTSSRSPNPENDQGSVELHPWVKKCRRRARNNKYALKFPTSVYRRNDKPAENNARKLAAELLMSCEVSKCTVKLISANRMTSSRRIEI